MIENFVDRVMPLIQNKQAKTALRFELQSHIQDKTDYYVELGYTSELAKQKANEDMGDPEEAGVPLNSLYHKKWYLKIATWIAVALIIFSFMVIPYIASVSDTLFTAEYNYAQMVNAGCMQTDLVLKDFASLFILFAVVVLIHFARKQRSIFLAATICAILIFQIVFPAFQPLFYSFSAFYAFVKLFTMGFGVYTDGIFGYCATPAAMEQPLFFVSLLTLVVLICYCGFVIVGIIRENLMKTGKNYRRPYQIFEKAVVSIIALTCVFMLASTVCAFGNIDDKKTETSTLRTEYIDYVVNADINKSYTDFKTEINEMGLYENVKHLDTNIGFDANIESFEASKNSLYLSFMEVDGVKWVNFADMLYDLDQFDEEYAVNASDFETLKKNMKSDNQNPTPSASFPNTWSAEKNADTTSLSEFMSTDVAHKAVSVSKHNESDKSSNSDIVEFSFEVEGNEYSHIELIFTEEKLSEIQYWTGE